MSATMTALTPCPMFLDGKWIQPNIASTPVFNPSTGEVIAECPAGGAAEVNAAVESASGGEIVDGEGDVEGGEGHRRILGWRSISR